MSADKPPLRLTWPARQDLTALLAHSERTWGEEQALAYEQVFLAAFDVVRRHPEIGEARPQHYAGCRIYPARRHVVYYRVDSIGIEVVRILHERQLTEGQFDDLD